MTAGSAEPPSGPPLPSSGTTDLDGGIPGKYRVVRPLRVGGTASIYLAVMRGENAFSREVVIKRPLPHLVADERARLMFVDEAHIAARLQHPNICQVLDLVSREGEVYLVLEYLRGIDLRELIKDCVARQEFLSAELAVWIAAEVASALHYSHEAKGLRGEPLELVHRDVSPKNIRLTFEGSVKLIDFGIARAAGRATETAAGTIKGTLGYMSPEQILGDEIDRRSDVFAFGICLYQMLTCRNPFDGATLRERVRRLTQEPVPNLRSFHPALDEDIERVVSRCLERDPGLRYASMLEVQKDLERYLARLHVVSPRQTLVRHLEAHFAEAQQLDPTLAHALHEASQSTAPIDPTFRLRFPDDPPTNVNGGPVRTGPTFSPPPSEQTTEPENPGDTRRLAAWARARLAGPASWLAGMGLIVGLCGIVFFLRGQFGEPVPVTVRALAPGDGSGIPSGPGPKQSVQGPDKTAPAEGEAPQASSVRSPQPGVQTEVSGPESRAARPSPPAPSSSAPERVSGPPGRSPLSSGSMEAGRRSVEPAAARTPRATTSRGGSSSGRSGGVGMASARGPGPPSRDASDELGGRERARQYFLAARSRERAGRWDEARLLYELAYEASKPRTPSSVYLNLGLLAGRTDDPARSKACLRSYLGLRPDAPEAPRVRTLLATMPQTQRRPCVTPAEGAGARQRYARAGSRIDAWIDQAMQSRLR